MTDNLIPYQHTRYHQEGYLPQDPYTTPMVQYNVNLTTHLRLLIYFSSKHQDSSYQPDGNEHSHFLGHQRRLPPYPILQRKQHTQFPSRRHRH